MRPLYYFVGLVCSLLIFELVFSYSDSPPPAFIGNIGEPGCDNCHGQTTCINPYSILEVWDTIALDTVPRDTFSFSIHILDSLNASFGFQFTCVDTSGQQSVGDFILIDTSSTSLDTMGLKYYTGHHNADTTRNWTVYWSPPAGYSGKVWFYWTVFVGCSDTLPPDSLPNIGAGSTTWGSFSHVFGNSVDSSVNIPPIANDDSVETLEDTPIAINVLQNDFDLDGVVMLDSFSLYDPPSGGTVVTDPGSGQMIYTPDINFTGLDFFTYYILDDSGGYSSLATVFITVVPVPDPPIAVDDGIIQTDEDVPVIVPVLINDYDPDGFLVPSSVIIVSSADNGTVSVNPITGEVTYYPNPNFSGGDIFYYGVYDNEGLFSNVAGVIIQVLPVDDAPVAVDDYVTMTEDAPCFELDAGSNDFDIDGDPISVISITEFPSNLSATLIPLPSGEFGFEICTPQDFCGQDTFWYLIQSFGPLGSALDTGMVVVTVTCVNDPPVAVDDGIIQTDEDVGVTVPVLINDYDVDGTLDLGSVFVGISPSAGVVSVDLATGMIWYTPDGGFHGQDTFWYQVSDDLGLQSGSAMVVVNVTDVNDAPVAVDENVLVGEDDSVLVLVLANDSDSDGVLDSGSVSVIGGPSEGSVSIDAVNGSVLYIPDAGYSGSDNFSYVVYDDDGLISNVGYVSVVVVSENDLPVALADVVTTPEDTDLEIPVLLNDYDVDGTIDSSTVVLIDSTLHGVLSIDGLSGLVSYIPVSNYSGLDSFHYYVSDNEGLLSNIATVIINVSPVDDPPVANNDTVFLFMNTDSCFSILANDEDVDNVLDNQSIILLNSGAFGTSTLSTINDTTFYSSFDTISQQWVIDSLDVVMSPVFCYTPDSNVTGTEVYNYVLESGDSFSQPSSIVIHIIEFNSPPVAMPDTLSISEDSPGQLAVLNNDSDAEDNIDSSLVVILTQPLTVSISVSSSGVVLVIPSLNWYGLDSFQYSVCDDGGPSLCDTSWGYILVSSVNDPPVVVIDIIEVDEDDLTPETDIVINDYDPDGDLDLSTFELLCQTTNGVTSAPSIGDSTIHIYYNSDENFHGTDTLCYAICDYGVPVLCDTTIVVFVVNSVNDPPVAVDDYVTMMEDTLCLELDAGSNDFDIDGDSVSVISITELPSNLSATLIPLPSGEFGFEICSPQDFCGLDTFWYLIQSFGPLGSGVDTGMVVVTVTCVNDPPVAVDDGIIQTDEDVGVTVPVLINDYDGDGTIDSSTVVLIDSTLHGVLSIDGLSGLVSYIPVSNYSGLDSFQYSVSDNEGLLSNIATVIINVSPVDDPPIAVDDYVTMMEDTLCLELDAESNDFDIDGDPISVISISDFPSTLTVSIAPLPSGDFGFEICSPQDFCGQDTFWYLIQSFGPLGSDVDTGMVVVTVTCVNDPPIAECDYLVLNMGTPDTVNILANDMDIDGNVDPSSVTIVSPPSHGSAIVTADSQMVYFPPPQYIGNDTLYYFVCDDGSPVLCDTACVIVSILAIPNPPIANADSFLTQENECIILDLLANDSDPDGDISPAGLSIFSQGSGGNVSWDFVIGNFVFCPEPNFSGDYFFQYQLCDNSGLCDTATGVVTVTPVIVCPSGIEDFMTILQYPYAASIEVTGNDILDSTAVFSIQVIDSPHNGIEQVIDPFSGTIQYTPNPGYSGLDSLSYQLCYLEQGGCCDSNLTWVYFTIEANHPPVAEADEFVTETDSCLFLPFLQNDDDPDGDELSWLIIDSVSNGSLTNQAGQLYYCPDSLFNGIETLEYQICDTFGGCDTALISIYVNAAIGIGEEMNFSLISFYPNPVIDFLEINIPGGRILHDLLILDVRGKQIRKVEGSFRSSFQVPFPYASGIYYLKYRQEGKEIIIRKVLKAND